MSRVYENIGEISSIIDDRVMKYVTKFFPYDEYMTYATCIFEWDNNELYEIEATILEFREVGIAYISKIHVTHYEYNDMDIRSWYEIIQYIRYNEILNALKPRNIHTVRFTNPNNSIGHQIHFAAFKLAYIPLKKLIISENLRTDILKSLNDDIIQNIEAINNKDIGNDITNSRNTKRGSPFKVQYKYIDDRFIYKIVFVREQYSNGWRDI